MLNRSFAVHLSSMCRCHVDLRPHLDVCGHSTTWPVRDAGNAALGGNELLWPDNDAVLYSQIGHALFDSLARETEGDQASGRSPLFDTFFRQPDEQQTPTRKRYALANKAV